jgi:hypothetical protein
MKLVTLILTIILVLLSFNTFCLAKDYYVDAVKGDDFKNGTTPAQAWKTISNALYYATAAVGNPAFIHLAAGRYHAGIGEAFPIILKDRFQLIGADPKTTIIDASMSSCSVIYCEKVNNISIQNITVTGGSGTKQYSGSTYMILGGGIYSISSTFSIQNCIIKGNSADMGGGVFGVGGEITILDSEISENTAVNDEGSGMGGGLNFSMSTGLVKNCLISKNTSAAGNGIFCGKSSPEIDKCVIQSNNYDPKNVDSGIGGGILCMDNSNPYLNSCIIKNNKARIGAGIACVSNASPKINECTIMSNVAEEISNDSGFGGGLFTEVSAPTVTNSVFEDNNASKGGGIYMMGSSSPQTINSIVIGCTAKEGGAIRCMQNASPNINLCTFSDNSANNTGAIYADSGCNTNLTSCILWNNNANAIKGPVTIKYSDVEFGYEGDGNIKQNPLFASGPWGDYYLSCKAAGESANSPCIDAGSEIPIMGYNQNDFITRSDGVFDSGRVDMGYHYNPHVFFGLTITPSKSSYKSGDKLTLNLYLKTAPAEIQADLYLILAATDGKYYSAMVWGNGVKPLAQNYTLSADLYIKALPFVNFTLPSTMPPINKSGKYTFYIAALKPKTTDFISNIYPISFNVQ